MVNAKSAHLKDHKARLQECTTFESFKEVQLQFISELIEEYDRDDEVLLAAARQIVADADEDE